MRDAAIERGVVAAEEPPIPITDPGFLQYVVGGRRKPIAVPASDFLVPADFVIGAYGFEAEPFPAGSGFSEIRRDKWGGIAVDKDLMTSIERVFAGGDSVRGPSLVVHAVRDARRAAQGILRYVGARAPVRPIGGV